MAVSISDAETESGNDKSDASDKVEIEEVEVEPEKHTKNTKYTKEDFIATSKFITISSKIPKYLLLHISKIHTLRLGIVLR